MTTLKNRRFPYARVHISGIGGAGTSGLARILLLQKIAVSGSDRSPGESTDALARLGASIAVGESADNIDADVQLLIHSAAIPDHHPERLEARRRHIPEMRYAQALGLLSAQRQTIAIAGTHGKTTTTTMTATILHHAGKRPGWLIGGAPQCLPAAAHWDNGTHFVVEACEYDRSFLHLSPSLALLHNVEADHMDYYGTLDALHQAFRNFAEKLGPRGVLLANWDDPAVREIASRVERRVVRYGLSEEATVRATNVDLSDGFAALTLVHGRRELAAFKLPLPGQVNLMNGLAAAAVALQLGIDAEEIARGLENLQPVRRRFDLVGERNGAPIIDDYAHHPTAVEQLLRTARKVYPERRLLAVFQAHQYGRLIRFFDRFVEALILADEVLICPTYAAREAGVTPGEPEERLRLALQGAGRSAATFPSLDAVLEHFSSGPLPDSLLLTIGAGDVTTLARRLANRRQEARPSNQATRLPAELLAHGGAP